jgi:transcriptional regulator with XRE-family HTH domain
MTLDLYQLGRRIAVRRTWRDWTQQELANRAHLTQATVARIEKGQKPGVHVQTLLAIADALGVSPNYLLGRSQTAEEDVPDLAPAGPWEKVAGPV